MPDAKKHHTAPVLVQALAGLESELGKQGIEVRRGWDEFARYLVPPISKRYIPLWTFTFLGAILSIFFFMAGSG